MCASLAYHWNDEKQQILPMPNTVAGLNQCPAMGGPVQPAHAVLPDQVEQDLVVAAAHCLSTGATAALQQQAVSRMLAPLNASLASLTSLYQGAGGVRHSGQRHSHPGRECRYPYTKHSHAFYAALEL